MIDQIKSRLSLIQKFNLENQLSDYSCHEFLNDINDAISDRVIKPVTKENHVGIEIEFCSHSDFDDIMDDIFTYNLIDSVALGTDCSVYGPGEGYEIKLLGTEKTIHDILGKVCKLLSNHGAVVNDTCGLHVHIDCRNRKRDKVYRNMMRAQHLLYKMNPEHRQDNGYSDWCWNEDNQRSGHYAGVEWSNKGTVEVRLHEGTTDFKTISNWVKLLVKIANKKTLYPKNSIKTYKSVINRTNFDKETKDYINERVRLFAS